MTPESWLKQNNFPIDSLQPMQNDASFRYYFRVHHNTQSYVLMDARADKKSIPPYIAIANRLREARLNAPEIIRSDPENGFLLISDFGNQQFRQAITAHNTEYLYQKALESLAILQCIKTVPGLPIPFFSQELMLSELFLFKEWFLEKQLALTLSPAIQQSLSTFFQFLVTECSRQPIVFMHRDYHSANLMILPHDDIGILDFQDAFMGPVTYDVVSLLKDCYLECPTELSLKLVLFFKEAIQLSVSNDTFLYWFDMMSVQRHLKALLTFSRKYHRDHNDHYLQYIPRTVHYIKKVSERYTECAILLKLISERDICGA